MVRVPFVGLLTFLLLSTPALARNRPGAALGAPAAAPAALAVSVSETTDAVRIRVQVVGAIEPGSLDVGFEGRKAIVSARDADGRPLRAQTVQLPAAVVEDGATADSDAEDALVITLRKQRAPGPPGSQGDPGSTAR